MSAGIVVEYHEHQPVSVIPSGQTTPVWACCYVNLDGTQCDSVNQTPGFPMGWAGSHTMTRDAVDAHQRQHPPQWG